MSKKKSFKGKSVGPQGFFVEHVEKLVFGAVAAVILLCVVGAVGHDLYDKTPQQLADTLQDKERVVSQNKPETFPPLQPLAVKDYGEWVKKGVGTDGKPLTAAELQRRTWLSETTVGQPDNGIQRYQKRGEPEYLPIEDLRVFPKTVTFPLLGAGQAKRAVDGDDGDDGDDADAERDPADDDDNPGGVGAVLHVPRAGVRAPAGSISRGDYVAVITGTVPRKKQAELYQQVFEFAAQHNPSTDIPRYVTFLIQRADVTDGAELKETDWKSGVYVDENGTVVDAAQRGASFVSFVKYSWDVQQKWAVGHPEIVDVSRGQHVVPIEVKAEKEGEDRVKYVWTGFTAPLIPLLGEDWGKQVAGGFPLRAKRQGQNPAEMADEAGVDDALIDDAAADPAAIDVDDPFAVPGAGDPAAVGAGAGGAVQASATADILFRFFDFSISEGRRYRYRVRLLLNNPNYELRPAMLKNAKMAEGKYGYSDWSEPTDVVTASGFSDLLAGKVRAGQPESGREDSMTVIIKQRDAKTGAVITQPFSRIQRGQFVRLPVSITAKGSVLFPHPVTGVPTWLKDSPAHKDTKSYEFQSDDLVLDLMGDRDKPGEMLILDSTGFLTVRQQLTEHSSTTYGEQWRRLEKLHELLQGANKRPDEEDPAEEEGFDEFLPRRRR